MPVQAQNLLARTHSVAARGLAGGRTFDDGCYIPYSPIDLVQRGPFMRRDVIGGIALDFVLRLVRARVASVAFIVGISGMYFDDGATDVARFGIPADMVADFKSSGHGDVSRKATRSIKPRSNHAG